MFVKKEVYDYYVKIFIQDRRSAEYEKRKNKRAIGELARKQKIVKKRIAQIDDWLSKMGYKGEL